MLFLLHISVQIVTYNACSKQRAKNLTFKSYRPLVGPLLKCKVRAWPLQLNLRELARVIHQKCAAIPQEYYALTPFINEYTVPCYRCDTWPRVHKAFQNKAQDQAQVKNSSLWIVFKTSYNYLKYYYAHI